MAVLLIGTLETKGTEVAFVRDLLRRGGVECRLIFDVVTRATRVAKILALHPNHG